MDTKEVLKLSWANVKANMLRTSLTLIIIALGVMALVGILTAIDGIIYSMSSNFSYLGANSFSINKAGERMRRHEGGRHNKEAADISYDQAIDFKKRFNDYAIVSISFGGTGQATAKYKNLKTNPTMKVRGIDENYFKVTGYEIEHGRSFSTHELEYGMSKAIIGMEIVKKLFDGVAEKALNQIITIDEQKYTVVGVIKSKGSSMNDGSDKRIMIPLLKSKIEYAAQRSNFSINIAALTAIKMEETVSLALGEMRIVRGLKSYEENDFEIFKSDGIIEFLKENTVKLRAATIAIGLITLLGAAIGLMNIMLVSVTERTKEIGIAKALGATKRWILFQFMFEAIIVCMLGGILGILLAIPLGNIVTLIMGGSFLIPWMWISLGLAVCIIVGILSGLYPALKAASLDPVEALRYE